MNNRNLYEAPLLSKLAIAYRNRKMIADQIFPLVQVPVKEIQYNSFDRSPAFRRQKTIYGGQSGANVVDLKATKLPHTLKDRGQAAWLTEDERRQAGEYNLKALKIEMLKDILMLDLEIEIATVLRSTASLPLNDTLSGTAQWSHASSEPKKAIKTAQNQLLIEGNVLVVGKEVDDKLQLHPQVIAAVQYSSGAIDTSGILARYFGVEKYIVGESLVNSGLEGAADSMGFVWGKDAILLHVSQNPGAMLEAPSAGYLPIWGSQTVNAWRVYEKTPDPERGSGEGSQYLKVDGTYDVLLGGVAKLAFLFKNAVA